MNKRRGDVARWVAWIAIGASTTLLVLPLFVAERMPAAAGLELGARLDDGSWLPIGTDRRGLPFEMVLLGALSASGGFALAGTMGVLLGAALLGVFEANLRARYGQLAVQVLTLGAMAMPDVTLLLTVHASLPRETPKLAFDLIILGVVGALWVPPTSRLIASRVQSLQTSLFFTASRSMGANRWHLFRRELVPHLLEDMGWLLASIFPRFLHVELGLAYIGVEYHFRGVGQLLKSSYENPAANPYMWHLVIASLAAVWLSLLPMLVLRTFGTRGVPSS